MAASAFSIDEPAAPITAVGTKLARISYSKLGKWGGYLDGFGRLNRDASAGKASYEILGVGKLTVMAQRNKLEIKNTTLVSTLSAQITIQSRLRPVILVKDLDRRV